eukprot:g27769.t1
MNGNPIESAKIYRLYVMGALPSLRSLDHSTITHEEANTAAVWFQGHLVRVKKKKEEMAQLAMDAIHLCKEDDSHKIGELPSTAICGNDITASCFYVVGELSKNAGVYSPICTLLSSLTLYCFRSVYGEVVTALPLNGGIYNLLLNSSTKQTASVAACLTILSYTATGVVSSVSAADYLKCSPMFSGIESVPTAICILGFFAACMLMGMQDLCSRILGIYQQNPMCKESSAVASMLFVFHLLDSQIG